MLVPPAAAQRSPHMAAETRRTHPCVPPVEARSAHGGGDEANTCVCHQQKRGALSAHGGRDEGCTCVCRPQMRTALSAHGCKDEADTCMCRQQCVVLSTNDGRDKANTCAANKSA